MAAFLKEVGDALPELRPDLNGHVGRYGPDGFALAPVVRRLQRLIDRGDTVPLARLVGLFDAYYRPDDPRLKPFNDQIEQFVFDALTFNCGGGRVSWVVFTPKLRRAYRDWTTRGLGLRWENFAPPGHHDLPDA